MREFSNELTKKSNKAFYHLRQAQNFEEALQKEIANLIDQLITAEELEMLFSLQWENNLKKLAEGHLAAQHNYKTTGETPAAFTPSILTEREKIVKEHFPEGGRILYVGSGVGTECFRYQQLGYEVVGIDTEATLVQTMKSWSGLLGIWPRGAVMNILSLGFLPQLFDVAIIEIYGGFPSKPHRFLVQKELARVLRPKGFALLVANRFHYTQYMQRQSMYKDMQHKSYYLDCLIEQIIPGKEEETNDIDSDKLVFGVSRGSYSPPSLMKELSAYFDISRCWQAVDKRYLLAWGCPKASGQNLNEKPGIRSDTKKQTVEAAVVQAQLLADKLEHLVESLEGYANTTKDFITRSAAIESNVWEQIRDLLYKK
jgi:SAM-dependent methyltransferase